MIPQFGFIFKRIHPCLSFLAESYMFNNLTPVVRNLLAVNILIYLVSLLIGGNDLFVRLFGLYYIYSPLFSPYQFVTHIFVHSGFQHLLMNMLGLLVFGPMLEVIWGGRRFLTFYLICGLGAGFLFFAINSYEIYIMQVDTLAYLTDPGPDNFIRYIHNYDVGKSDDILRYVNAFAEDPKNPNYINSSVSFANKLLSSRINSPMVGASGAIFGVLMGFGLLFPNTELMLLFPPIPIKAKYVVGIYGATSLFNIIHPVPGDNVAHFAHLGGMLFGYILITMWRKNRNSFW